MHLSSVHPPFDPRIFHKEASSLVEAGYHVVIVAPHTRDQEVEGVRVKAVPRPGSRVKRMLVTAWQVWRVGLSERAQLYHFHDPELLFAGLVLKVLGRRVIYDVHEDLPKTFQNKDYLPGTLRRWAGRVANLVEKMGASKFDAIVAATDDIAGNFRNCRTVATVRNYPRLSHLMAPANRDLNRRKFRCAYVGALSEPRGVSEMVDSMALLNDLEDVELILCGSFSPPAFEFEVRQLDGFRRTDYRGWIDPLAVPNLLGEVDVGLVCIQPEDQYLTSLPTKLFEYMLAGLPVVASNFPFWREIVEANHCGICVDPQEPVEIAEAIRYLYRHPEARVEMGSNGRNAVLRQFNWESQSKVLLTLYAELFQSETGRPSLERTLPESNAVEKAPVSLGPNRQITTRIEADSNG